MGHQVDREGWPGAIWICSFYFILQFINSRIHSVHHSPFIIYSFPFKSHQIRISHLSCLNVSVLCIGTIRKSIVLVRFYKVFEGSRFLFLRILISVFISGGSAISCRSIIGANLLFIMLLCFCVDALLRASRVHDILLGLFGNAGGGK